MAFLPIRKLSISAHHAKPFSEEVTFHYLIEVQNGSPIRHTHITEETYPEWCDECKKYRDEEKKDWFHPVY